MRESSGPEVIQILTEALGEIDYKTKREKGMVGLRRGVAQYKKKCQQAVLNTQGNCEKDNRLLHMFVFLKISFAF